MKNKFQWGNLVIVILSILLVSVSIFALNKEKETISNKEPEKIYVDKENQETLENFNRKDAVKAFQDILVSIGKDVEGKDRTPQERLEALDDEEITLEDVINKETIEMLHISEEFETDDFNRRFLASSLLTYYQVALDMTKDTEFKPVLTEETFEEMVYFDTVLQLAHIPFDVFIGENRGIAFEMQYMNGEWKFSPYTSMMSLVMILNYEQQYSQTTEKTEAE